MLRVWVLFTVRLSSILEVSNLLSSARKTNQVVGGVGEIVYSMEYLCDIIRLKSSFEIGKTERQRN